MPNIAVNLRRIRKSKGLSQVELASALKISRTAVVLMEQGKRNVRAQEIEALASIFGCSTASLFNEAGPESNPGDEQDLLAEIGQTLSDADKEVLPQEVILRTLKIASVLTDYEARLGLDGGSLGPHSYDISPPKTAWEAAHQGIRAAAEERLRLNLGDAPIRDVDETLSSNRIRMAKCDLPADISGLFLNSRKTGLLLIVNRTIPVERRRFQFAHGYAHVLFDRNHGCLSCCQGSRRDFREIRASAFAIRFLVPESGVRRYLETLGKETLGRAAGRHRPAGHRGDQMELHQVSGRPIRRSASTLRAEDHPRGHRGSAR